MDRKKCSKCKIIKEASFFHKRGGVEKDKDWLRSLCKQCHREAKWRIRYGLTPPNFDELYKKQNGLCAICKNVAKCIDHNHKTGEIRGLLCGNCNLGMGLFKDSIENFKQAIKYLKD